MRLYRAVCAWLEADAQSKNQPEPDIEYVPQGNNFSDTQKAADVRGHELNADERPGPYGRSISLKWHANK